VLALKNRGCPDIFHCIEHVFFINQDFGATSACPEKQSCPEIFCCMEKGALIFFTAFNMYFLSIRIFEQLALALKNRVAQKFFAVWNILFTFRIFEQLALALKNRGWLNSLN